jgi:Immunity protein Imm1
MTLQWWDDLPDGNLYASWDVEGPIKVESVDHIDEMLETVNALIVERGIGQIFKLSASLDETLVAWIDVAGGAGWALTYDNNDTGAALMTTAGIVADDGSDDEADDEVTVRYADSWEDLPRSKFIDPDRARTEIISYFDTRTITESPVWERDHPG